MNLKQYRWIILIAFIVGLLKGISSLSQRSHRLDRISPLQLSKMHLTPYNASKEKKQFNRGTAQDKTNQQLSITKPTTLLNKKESHAFEHKKAKGKQKKKKNKKQANKNKKVLPPQSPTQDLWSAEEGSDKKDDTTAFYQKDTPVTFLRPKSKTQDIPTNADEWIYLLIDQGPDKKASQQFIKLFRSKKISDEIYKKVLEETLRDGRESILSQGLDMAAALPHPLSFIFLADFIKQEAQGSKLYTRAQALVEQYKTLASMPILLQVIDPQQENALVIELATKIILKTAQSQLRSTKQDSPSHRFQTLRRTSPSGTLQTTTISQNIGPFVP
ncbi:MAG: hypothetical protein D6797_07800, partial [Bdellovibrio sp.]